MVMAEVVTVAAARKAAARLNHIIQARPGVQVGAHRSRQPHPAACSQLPHGCSSRRPRSSAPAHDNGLLWPIPDPPMQPNLVAMPQDHGRVQVKGRDGARPPA